MFNRVMRRVALIAAMSACSSVALAGEALTARDILRLTPGTFHAVVKGKFEVTVTLTRDGRAVGRVPGHEDKGRWTVRGDELCIVMPTWTRGRVECSLVIAEEGWYRGRNVAFRRL